MKSVSLLLGALFLFTSLSCSGGGGGSPGGGDNPPPGGKPDPSPMCGSRLNLPAAFGESCSGGSNLSLCLMSDKSQCQNQGLCLFHYRNGNPTAYCTANCNPAAKSCPKNFECRREGCDDKYVCVRTGNGESSDGFMVGSEAVPNEGYAVQSSYRLPSGDHILHTSIGSEVLYRSANGTWTRLDKDLLASAPRKMNLIDGVPYLFSTFYASRTAFAVIDGKAVAVTMPSAIPGNTCTNQPNVVGCNWALYQVFKFADGSLGAIGDHPKTGYTMYKRSGTSWKTVDADKAALSLSVIARPMQEGGYITTTSLNDVTTVHVSADLQQWQALPAPPTTKLRFVNLSAFSANEIWLRDEEQKYFRWTGSAWVREAAIDGATSVNKLGPTTYVADLWSKTMVMQNGCWKTIKNSQVYPPLIRLGDQAGFLFENKLNLFDLNFDPEY